MIFASFLFAAIAVTNDWENPAVNAIDRLPPRTYSMPLKDVAAALTDDLEPQTPYRRSLNGTWKFRWAGNPDLRPKDFWRTDFDDRDWYEIDVPSCVECRGFGNPIYVNQEYPHANTSDPKKDPANFAHILDFETKKPDYNPVSSYRTTFTVPEGWKDRRVILRFDGVYSAYYVWVNGHRVGYAEDSKLPSEFDITPYLNSPAQSNNQTIKQSENVLAVEVYRWSDGSFLEDQDMFRFSGIFRDVTLWSMPKESIWDFHVTTALTNDWRDATISVSGIDGTWYGTLYDAAKQPVAHLSNRSNISNLPNVRLWSAEDPYLYTLVLKKGDDLRMKRVGFKEQKVVGNTVLVNGRAIKFKGVNRHEHSPENGRTVSLAEMTRDITLMKRYNIDTVRTSHYPNHHAWYDLCDRYGIYLVAEANVEGHGAGFGEDSVGKAPEWADSIVERNARHVVFYRNHPSVTFFSAGNETAHGDGFRRALAEMRRLSPAHPTIWECGNRDADIDSKMYPTLEWLETCGRFGEGKVDKMPLRYAGDSDNLSPRKPFLLVEYAHAMGNAVGNFQEYWDVFYAHPSLLGGCIWDWIDQALWKASGRIDPKTGRPGRHLAYGGDWDEWPNNANFCCNGVIGPERKVSAKLVEVGHVHRNLVVTRRADGLLELWNRFGFTFADAFACTAMLRRDGVAVASVPVAVPHLAPLSRGMLPMPMFPAIAFPPSSPGHEWLVDFAFTLKVDTPWAERGWTVARDQLAWAGAWDFSGVTAPAPSSNRVKIAEDAASVTVTAGETRAVFSRKTGTLGELTMNGKTILRDPAPGFAAGPRFSCTRATTDNDGWLDRQWRWREGCREGGFTSLGLSCPNYHAQPLKVDGKRVLATVEMTGGKSGGFRHEAAYVFAADGSVTVENKVTPFGTVPKALPRMGLSLLLDPSLERVEYYGRGPYENYVDRRTGSFLGVYGTTVTDLFEDYVRPQDNGYRTDVRWAAFTDEQGRGVRISGSEPLFVQALHYTWEDFERARHRGGQTRFRVPLVPRPEVCLNLDVRQTGLGNGSCGPDTLPKYVFPVEPLAWRVKFEPMVPRVMSEKEVSGGRRIADLSREATVNEWQSVPYETVDGIRGTLAFAPGTMPTGRRVEIPLKARGPHRLWLALGGARWNGSSVRVRFKGERVPVRMNAAFYGTPLKDERMHLGELEYREADLKGDEVLVVENVTGANSELGWVRLDPIAAVTPPQKDAGMVGTNDSYAPYDTLEEFFEPFRFLADSPVKKIYFCVGNGSQTFSMPSKVAYAAPYSDDFCYARPYDRAAAKSFNALHRDHPHLLNEAIDYAHGLGLEFHVAFRTGCFVDHARAGERAWSADPGEAAVFPSTPATCCRHWDGTPVARFSYANGDVQDFFLRFYAEALDSKADGINLIFTRALPAMLFEPAFRERFKTRYGTALASTNDARIVTLRCEIMTDFLRRVKTLAGKRPLSLTLLGSPELNRSFGLDVSALARAGIVDEFVVDGDQLTKPRRIGFDLIDLDGFKQALAGTKATFRVQLTRWWGGLDAKNFRAAAAAGSNSVALWDAASTPWQDWERIRRIRPNDFDTAERWAAEHPDSWRIHPFKTLQGFDFIEYPWWSAY